MELEILGLLGLIIVFGGMLLLGNLHWNRTVRKVNRFPGPNPLPVVGNIFSLLNPEKFLNTLTGWKEKYGDKYRIYLGYSSPMVIISSPVDAEVILRSHSELDKGDAYYPGEAVFGDGLLTAPGAKWRQLRKMMAPSFNFQTMEEFIRVQNIYCKTFAADLEGEATSGDYVDLAHRARCSFATGVIHTITGSTAKSFGIEPDKLVDLVDIFAKNWWNRLKRPWLKNKYLWRLSFYGKREIGAIAYMDWLLDTIINRRKEEFRGGKLKELQEMIQAKTSEDDDVENSKVEIGLLDRLLLRQAEGDTLMSDEEIRFNLMTMLAAGYDTSGLTLTWLLYNLARNPEHQALVQEELDEIFSDNSERDVTLEDLTKLKYLDACMKESLRLLPTVPLVVRKLQEDLKLSASKICELVSAENGEVLTMLIKECIPVVGDGAVLPKNSDVMIYIWGIHRDGKLYPDPEVFDPSRFLSENEGRGHRFAFIPFSAGPRNCIGMRHAICQIKTMAVHILRKYSVTSDMEYSELVLIPDIVLTPGNGIHLGLSKRKTL